MADLPPNAGVSTLGCWEASTALQLRVLTSVVGTSFALRELTDFDIRDPGYPLEHPRELDAVR